MDYYIIKKCEKDLGCFALRDIKKNTLILSEEIFTINQTIQESENIYEYIIKIIKMLLKYKYQEFTSMVPEFYDNSFNKYYQLIQKYHLKYLSKLSKNDILLYFIKYKRNVFRYGNNKHGALFIGTRFNHNCDNNINFIINNNYMDFITNRNIKKDEELFITYISSMQIILFNNDIYRKKTLLNNYGFICNCNKCKNILIY
jgi:23S rRNA C2498 (ribose-2'-O)-methylase RlmM